MAVSRLYINGKYRTPLKLNEYTSNPEFPVVWRGGEKRSDFPAKFDATFKLKGQHCSTTYAYSPVTGIYPSAGTTKLTGYLTTPEYMDEIYLPNSSAKKWKTIAFQADLSVYYGKDRGWCMQSECDAYAGLMDNVTYKDRYNIYNGPTLIKSSTFRRWLSSAKTWVKAANSKTPWGFTPAWDGGGMFASESSYPYWKNLDTKITMRFDILFGIPVSDTKFHFVTFYESGAKDDFYDHVGTPISTFATKHIKYGFTGANKTHDNLAGEGTYSGIRYITEKNSEKIYHYWWEVSATKGSHQFITPIGLAFSGNKSASKKLNVYDNAFSYRIL